MFRLARDLSRTVEELSASLDQDELLEWYAFYQLDPGLHDRLDYNEAYTRTVIANALDTSSRRHKLKEYLLSWMESGRMTEEEKLSMRTALQNSLEAQGIEIIVKERPRG